MMKKWDFPAPELPTILGSTMDTTEESEADGTVRVRYRLELTDLEWRNGCLLAEAIMKKLRLQETTATRRTGWLRLKKLSGPVLNWVKVWEVSPNSRSIVISRNEVCLYSDDLGRELGSAALNKGVVITNELFDKLFASPRQALREYHANILKLQNSPQPIEV